MESEYRSAEPETPAVIDTKKADTRLYLLLSFFVPCVLMLIGWIFQGVHPFGDGQILVTDFWHQYYPFANILHGKLQDFSSSLLYTWESGMGSNFLAMMAYYAASPLNFLTLLVPGAFLREAMTFILMLKIGFAGLFTGMFLKYTFRRNDVSICCFGIMYALCSYIMGYYWNTIWIDTVALLPLVMLGAVKLVREKKITLFSIAFALALISNYYIGLFICVFSVIAFFCICLFESTGFKRFIFSGFRMLGAAALGLAISAFMLLPAFFALQLTNSADNTFPTDISWYESWLDILANMTAFREPTVKEGLPNLYCGIICVIFIGMFLRSGSVRIREKIVSVLILAFILVSCNMNKLNFIWHGFHFTNMLPYRFSFLFSFVLVVMGYRVFDLILSRKIKLIDTIAMTLIAAGAFAVTWFSERDTAQTQAMWMSFAMSMFYIVVIFLYERRVLKSFVMCALVSLGLMFEMFMQVRTGTAAVGTSDYDSYPTKNAEIQQLLDEIDTADDDLFFRTEISTWYSLNDPALYSYNGVSQFSSMANRSVTTYLRTLGLPGSEAGNRYYYALSSPVTNMFTGIKYVISRTGEIMETYAMEKTGTSGSVDAYKNKFTLPIGFMTDGDILTYNGEDYSQPFDAQNAIFSKATGITEPLFTPIDVTHSAHTGMNGKNGVYKSRYGCYTFSIDETADSHSFKFNFIPEEDSVLYAYFWADGAEKVNILQDDVQFGSYSFTKQQGFIAPIGTCEAGVKTSVCADVTDSSVKRGSVRIYVYKLNTDVLEMGYELLSSGGIQLQEFSDNSLEGTVTAFEDGVCYFSIPQEKGWTAYVDGERVETKTVGNAMLAVPVSKGTHTIKLKYIPQGAVAGAAASGCGIVIWCAALYAESRRKRINTAKEVKCEES